MGVFVRAVVTGFGFSLGAALFKRVSAQMGLDADKKATVDADTADGDDAPDAA